MKNINIAVAINWWKQTNLAIQSISLWTAGFVDHYCHANLRHTLQGSVKFFHFFSNYFQTETVAAFSQVRLAHPWMHFIIWCVGGAKLINKSMENANIEMCKVSWRSRFCAKKSRLTLFAFCRYREKKRYAACCVPPDDRMIVTLWKMSLKEEQLLTGNASDWCSTVLWIWIGSLSF